MSPRIHIVPVEPMARRLAGYRPEDRATAQDATLILLGEGYCAEDIHAGLDAALDLVRQGAVAAASDHPIARTVGYARDLAACLAILVGGSYLWGLLA